VKSWAYEIYKSEKAVHDSILWIGSTDSFQGTGEDTIEMLANVGVAYQVKKNGCVKRVEEIKECSPGLLSIRVWSKEIISVDTLVGLTSITISGSLVSAGNLVIHLGEETRISSGSYNIREVSQAYSRKNGCYALKNSVQLLVNS